MEIFLLGQFMVRHAGETIAQLNHARLQELLAYLLLQRGKPVSRQQLAFLFWPETNEEQARTNLRNLLYRLRKSLPTDPEFLNIDETRIQWRVDIPCLVDVAEFETTVSQAESAPKAERIALLEKALGLYGGDLLPECYSDWLLAERERLRQVHRVSLRNLAELYEGLRAYPKAIARVQELLRLEPLDENAYTWLMRLHALDGNRGEALLVYHTCAEVLHRELGIEPGPHLRSLTEQLLGMPASAVPVAPATALVARQTEWEILTRAWRELVGGGRTLQMILIAGEAGIGKTHLARAFVDWVRRQGYPNATAICYESGRGLAYASLAAWLANLFERDDRSLNRLAPLWKSEISRLLPELRIRFPDLDMPAPLTEKWQLLHFFEALRQAFNNQRSPVFLFLDDIQWCDAETLEWLAYLQSKPPDQKLAIIATARSESLSNAHPAMQFVNRSNQNSLIELQPFDSSQTRRLLELLTGERLDAGLAEKIYTLSEGNPLFATEMARFGLDHYLGKTNPLPERVQSVIAWRLNQLSPSARQTVEMAAIIGRSFSYDLLCAASGLEERKLVEAIDEGWRQRIFREQDSQRYDFSHERVRQVVYEGQSHARRRLGHQQVAAALEQIYAGDLDKVAEQIAYHLEFSGQSERAVLFYERAAQVAQKLFALSHAIEEYEKALHLLGSEPGTYPQAVRLYEQLGLALLTSGQYAASRQAFEAALGRLGSGEKITRARLQRRIAQCWSSQQLYDEAGQALKNALAELGDRPPEGLEGEWKHDWIETRLLQVDYLYFKNQPDEMQAICDQLAQPVELYGTLGQQAEFWTLQSMLANRRQRFHLTEKTVQFVRRGLKLAEKMGDPLLIARKRFALGFNLLWYGDRPAAIEQLTQALALAEQLGATFSQDQALAYLAIAFRMDGDPEQVEKYARRGLALAEVENHPSYQGAALANLAWLAYWQDDLVEAQRLGESALLLWGTIKYPFLWLANFPLAAVAVRSKDIARAQELLADILNPSQQLLPEELQTSLMKAIAQSDETEAGAGQVAVCHALEIAQNLGYF